MDNLDQMHKEYKFGQTYPQVTQILHIQFYAIYHEKMRKFGHPQNRFTGMSVFSQVGHTEIEKHDTTSQMAQRYGKSLNSQVLKSQDNCSFISICL